MVTLDAAAPVSPDFTTAVSRVLEQFLDRQDQRLAAIHPTTGALVRRARAFSSGGKRLRPAFCAWGFRAAGGPAALPDAVVAAAASLDLLHVSALVHDDVMDASDSRRGVPSAHRQFEADHGEAGWRGDAAAFGHASAILLGDLLLMWSDELFRRAGLDADAVARAQPHLEAMRTEVTAGQYLDVVAQAQRPLELTREPEGRGRLAALVNSVVTWKSASYTVRRPLLVGAALAGADADQSAALSDFAQPLGRAFQYRDDVLGVFGDAALTGKESGEDLREGKLTLLAVEAFAGAAPDAAAELGGLFGRPGLDGAEVERARAIIVESGALDAVEAEIGREYAAALAVLDGAPLEADARAGLANLAALAVRRAF